MMDWCDESEEFKAAVKIAFSAEFLYWEQLSKSARENPAEYKDILPTINRKLAKLESFLMNNGLRKSMYSYVESEPVSKSRREDEEAIQAMETLF